MKKNSIATPVVPAKKKQQLGLKIKRVGLELRIAPEPHIVNN